MAWRAASKRASYRDATKLNMLFSYPSPQPSPARGEGVYFKRYLHASSRLVGGVWRSCYWDACMRLHAAYPFIRERCDARATIRLHTPSPLVGEGWGEGATN
jgi:hypothetical protein